jgi:AcrR family transcriptional regulator
MGRAKFTQVDFFAAALTIMNAHGPAAVTIASITTLLKAPTGSFYHRFASRNVLLGALWLRTVRSFQDGISAALDADDGLRAALHSAVWARTHLEEARLLLLYDRRDFVQGEWPEELRDSVAEMTSRMEGSEQRRARVVLGADGPEEARIAQFLIAELPVAVIRQHLLRGEAPPPLADRLIRITYRATVADYRARKRQSRAARLARLD